ncbi:hypothetical protein Y032_0242g3425 [Ancylostoma ceylanicum]|uniref:Uncharacterized protein n=1 Tax=Ancylostoma ceylanicum TaxID=53326 RepID=A0A016SEL2_9BILA|nr:hypothetical protein Y032_0242g3425 [Ancylostoma ceylanicum]
MWTLCTTMEKVLARLVNAVNRLTAAARKQDCVSMRCQRRHPHRHVGISDTLPTGTFFHIMVVGLTYDQKNEMI